MAGKKVKVSVVAETKKFSRAFRNLSKEAGIPALRENLVSLGKAVTKTAVAFSAATSVIGAKMLAMGADLEQSTGAIEDVFKNIAGKMKGFADNAAKNVGLSKHSYQELATLIGSQLKNAGVPMEELGDKTNNLIVLASDLSAMFGGDTREAVNALSSALKGERDPIERYGVSLKQAAIDAKALELGFQKTKDGFSQEAQAAATLAIIYEQTKDAKGKFARETGTMAHQMQVLKASLQTTGEVIGAAVLPVLTQFVQLVSDWLQPRLQQLSAWVQAEGVPALKAWIAYIQTNVMPTVRTFAGIVQGYLVIAFDKLKNGAKQVIPTLKAVVHWAKENRSWLLPLVKTIATLVAGFLAVRKVLAIFTAFKVAILAARGAVIAFNVAIRANPLGALLAVLVAVGIAVYNWLQENEEARQKLIEIWNYVVENVSAFLATLQEWFWDAVQAVSDAWNWLKDSIYSIFETINGYFWGFIDYVTAIPTRVYNGLSTLGTILYNLASSAWTSFKNAVIERVSSVITYVTGIPGRIKTAIGNLGSLLWNAGTSVIQGFLDGISSMFGAVKDKLGALTSWLPDWKGPASRDAVILRKSGQLVIGGLIRGFQDEYGNVRRSLGDFTNSLSGAVDLDLTPKIHAVASYRRQHAAALPAINITVNALEPTYDVGRRVAEAIRRFHSVNGARP